MKAPSPREEKGAKGRRSILPWSGGPRAPHHVRRLLPIVIAAILSAISVHAQVDIHNGPVAIRPMVTAPSLIGKTPPIPPRCAAERAQLKETLRAALNDKDNHRGTHRQIRARWVEADKALAASTNVMDPDHKPTYCDEAWQWAEEYVLGD